MARILERPGSLQMSQVQVLIVFLSPFRIFQLAAPITLDLHACRSEAQPRWSFLSAGLSPAVLRQLAWRTPVWSLSRPRRPFFIEVLQTMLLPPPSAPTATGWSDNCRAGFAPAEEWRLLTAHVVIHAKCCDLGDGGLGIAGQDSHPLRNGAFSRRTL